MHRSALLVLIISVNIHLRFAFVSVGHRLGRNLNTSNYLLSSPSTRCTFLQPMSTTTTSSSSASTTPIPDDTTTSTTEDVKLSDSLDMLEKWIEHDDHSYHLNFLNATQSNKIRVALVEWYRANRRKLPWRGDAGPYDGSTAGYAASASSSNGKSKKRKDEGKDIRSFFASSASSKKKTKTVSPASSTKSSSDKQKDEKTVEVNQQQQVQEAREVTAYGIWVSEIMLQQTRVEAVIPYWLKWMNSFPTVQDLANATDEEVNSHWAGLGFYRRARYLHQGAKTVVNDYNGVVPNNVEELMKVEGIGRYTASAVASIAYGVEVPVVDGNVCRVLSRLTGIANHIKAPVLKDDLGWTLAEKVINVKPIDKQTKVCLGTPGEVNQALMELGATYCAPAGSGIDDNDPLKDFYVSTKLGIAIGNAAYSDDPSVRSRVESLIAASTERSKQCKLCDRGGVATAYYNMLERMTSDLSTNSKTKPEIIYAISGHASLPIPPPKKSKREEVIAVAVISSQVAANKERCWLMMKRPSEGLLAGQWEFPSTCVWNSSEEAKKEKKSKEKKKAGSKPAAVQVPIIDPDVRSDALDSLLSDIFKASDKHSTDDINKRVQLKNEPIVHIFSHVSHTMWVEHGKHVDDEVHNERWNLNDREVGWMTESMMATVGITSGVRKVLAAVQK